MESRDAWLHRQVLLRIIFLGLVIVIAAKPNGRRVSGEDTDAQAILKLGRGIMTFKLSKMVEFLFEM